MLLQQLNEFAESRNLLDNLAFKPKAVRWIITLDTVGNLVGQGPVETVGEKKRGKEFSCPQTTRPKVAGGVAEFLADGITGVFGLDTDPDKTMADQQRMDRDKNNHRKYEDFWEQIDQASQATGQSSLQGMLVFKPEAGVPPPFLRWGTSPEPKPNEKQVWWVTKADGEEVKMGPDNFSFRMGDTLLLEEDSVREFWREAFAKENEAAETDAPRGLCLVTGEMDQPIAMTHNPKIKGVPNTQSFGAAIVSFDKDAFGSYGFEQSLNASTSTLATTGYATALNAMLGRDDHSIRLGQAACCFWTRNQTDATSGWGALLNQADPKAVANFLKAPWAGQEREALNDEEFFAVTLAGNAGRIVVRHWFQATLEAASENLKRWFGDLDLVPARLPTGKEKMPPLALFRLACTTVRASKDLQPNVIAQLFRAALEGVTPSLTLLHPMLNRLRVDMARDGATAMLNHSRFAFAKLILNRNRKETIMTIETEQTKDAQDAAYQCGRLLAILAEAQSKAHDYQLEGAGVTERYFGTAMASPASVFPLILKLNRHHLNKIRKSDRYRGHERFLDEAIQDVLTHVSSFPRTLDLHAQGRFAIGFYQQKAADRVAREAAKAKKNENQN
jgi:CRISPR-associated protein Csd1